MKNLTLPAISALVLLAMAACSAPGSNKDAPDTAAPSVSLTAPASGAALSGTATLSATATDNVGVAGVKFRVDGADVDTEDLVAPYSLSWNTASATAGSHQITAVARDSAGNSATSAAVTVTVSNADGIAPVISLTAPAAGATVSGTATVSADATDNIGVVGVQFRLDGVSLGAEDTSAPYTRSWDSTTAINGTHSLSAIARDAAGNNTMSAAVTVTVSNADVIAPVVSLTAPAAGATVTGSATVSADATDNIGVVGVQFRLDGVN
ncbi:MAG: Ig-like domain-containing protein, partial [Pseudomonadota bacterium]